MNEKIEKKIIPLLLSTLYILIKIKQKAKTIRRMKKKERNTSFVLIYAMNSVLFSFCYFFFSTKL